MARSAKTMMAAAKLKPAARKKPGRAKPQPVAPLLVPPRAKMKAANTAVKATSAKAKPARMPMPAAAAATPARLPPPSKGELRAHIEKLAASNAALKAKSRETNRAVKAANKRIAELEAEVTQLQQPATRAVSTPSLEKGVRSGRPPRSREIDAGNAVPPGVAALEPEPLDAQAKAASEALEETLHGQ